MSMSIKCKSRPQAAWLICGTDFILSRKGFDSSAGGVASPIFPSDGLCSLPIPEPIPGSHSKRYEEIKIGNRSLGTIVNDLTEGKVKPDTCAHLDPDLNMASIPRLGNWKPIFGQAGAAERHLQNQGVNKGDVFIFYGWFRRVEEIEGRYRYVKDASDSHVIFGWLQVERRIPVGDLSEIPPWALEHPHCKRVKYSNIDSIYISTDYLKLPNVVGRPGAGVFQKFDPALCLTAPGKSRSVWRLPRWFYPSEKKPGLSYHTNSIRWRLEKDCVLLNSVGRGQEFVLDCQEYPEAVNWLTNILCLCDSR